MKRPAFSPVRKEACRSAFSLVEIVLALGIFSFAFIAILGLIPMGMSVARDAIRTLQKSQITDQILNSLQTTPFDGLADFEKLYTADGSPTTDPSKAFYFVSVHITRPVNLPSAASEPSPSSLATVQLTFRTSDNKVSHHSSTIANMGK